MVWALLLLGLFFAPIVWAFTKGRDVRSVSEDHEGMSGYGEVIKHRDWPGGPTGSGGASEANT